MDTSWTMVYRFNSYLYLTMTIMLAFSCFGLVYTQIFAGTLACLQLGNCVNLSAIIVTGVYQFGMSGARCSLNLKEYNGEADTFANDSLLLKTLFITQCSLFIPFICCTWVGLFTGCCGGAMGAMGDVQKAVNEDNDVLYRVEEDDD